MENSVKNPFVLDSSFMENKLRVLGSSGTVSLVDSHTGEIHSAVSLIGKNKRVDTERFVKIYPSLVVLMFSLSTPGLKVLAYILFILGYEDEIVFRVSECMKVVGYKSRSHVYDGLKELEEKKVIAKHPNKKKLYINPTMFYKGNRSKLVDK